MKRISSAVLSGAALVGVLALGACAGTWRDGTTEESSGLTPLQFGDIPCPDGMRLQTGLNESHSIEVGSFRYGDLYYYGSLPVPDVADYMKRSMPRHAWELVSEDWNDGRVVQTWERVPQSVRCEVFEDSGGVVRMQVHVRTPGS